MVSVGFVIFFFFFFFNDTATTEIYTLSLHDALPISSRFATSALRRPPACRAAPTSGSETSTQLGVAREQVRIEVTAGYRRRRRRYLPQLSLRATVSIRLRATGIRRCRAPWR